MADKPLKDLPIITSIELNNLIPVSTSGASRNISFKDLIEAGTLCYKYNLEPNQEIEIHNLDYGLYQLDDYNSGLIALYIVGHYQTKVIASIGTFGTNPDFGGLSLYKKIPNGPLFCKNGTGTGHSIGFKRL
ncbi:hypothetical protein [Bacteroides fragilis]